MNVAVTLVKLKMDLQSICGGLLHDVVEDCDVSEATVREEFGDDIANIVIGCTKISKIKFKTKEETQAENFRKMVVAMAKDIRVIIVKLADRMHNMLTLQYVSKERQVKKAQETLDIYVPLASRLGINSVKSELEDLCLRFLHPEFYYRLAEKIAMKKSERESYIHDSVQNVIEHLSEYSIKADVSGRPKHFYSIYKKMHNRGVDYDQIQDLLAFRIIVNNITECYKCLGIIHSSYTPVPGRFKDYIAIPKVNGYQSLHTTVIGLKAERIEIQIRTAEMHEIAETGVAAHWLYKEKDKKPKHLKWIDELMEYNREITQSSEFMDVVKNDLDIGGIFVFTPTGDVRELRYGATPLDFAFSVHTAVGSTCVGAKVNGKMVPLKYRLKSGDTVEVLTSKAQTPSKDWLKIVKTSRARTKIKQHLLKIEREKNRTMGEELLEKALRTAGTTTKALEKKNEFNKAYDQLYIKDLPELHLHIGSGRFSIKQIFDLIPSLETTNLNDDVKEKRKKEFDSLYSEISNTAKKKAHKDNAVIVDGLDDIMVRMGKCCNPIPGDPIVGFITRGRGVTIHTHACPRVREIEDARKIFVEWNSSYAFRHPVSVRVITHDRPGTLSRITNNIHGHGINIKSAIAKSLPDMKGSFLFEVEVKDYSEFLKVVSIIESMEEIISVTRA
jgi:GTP diphosphokinase / guanosine-3',5'-bis(diphosphate) 3'-diphosphatase